MSRAALLRRWPWLAASAALVATLALLSRGRRAERDDLSFLRAIALNDTAAASRVGSRRWTAAMCRCARSGLVVLVAHVFYLTPAGWARAGLPLAPLEVEALRYHRAVERGGTWVGTSRIQWSAGGAVESAFRGVRARGLADEQDRLTAAGRAVLEAM